MVFREMWWWDGLRRLGWEEGVCLQVHITGVTHGDFGRSCLRARRILWTTLRRKFRFDMVNGRSWRKGPHTIGHRMRLWVQNSVIANYPRTVVWIWYCKFRWEQKWGEKDNEQVTCGTWLPQFSILTPQALNESIYTMPQFWIWYILWVWRLSSFISWHSCIWGDREFLSSRGSATWEDLSSIEVFPSTISSPTGRT